MIFQNEWKITILFTHSRPLCPVFRQSDIDIHYICTNSKQDKPPTVYNKVTGLVRLTRNNIICCRHPYTNAFSFFGRNIPCHILVRLMSTNPQKNIPSQTCRLMSTGGKNKTENPSIYLKLKTFRNTTILKMFLGSNNLRVPTQISTF